MSYTKSHQHITVPSEYAYFQLNSYFQINSQLFVLTQLCKALHSYLCRWHSAGFDVLLTMQLSIILAITNLMHKFLFYNTFLYSSTCFKHRCAHHQEVRCNWTATYRAWWYQMLYNTILTPDDEHNSARNMQRNIINLL